MVSGRLDVVVRLRDREEERRLEQLAMAQRRVAAARESVRDAEAGAARELNGGGRAADYCVYEAARARALEAVKRTRAELDAALQAEAAARAAWTAARAQADAVRRVAEARHAEALRLAETRERRAADDLVLLRMAHTG